MLFVRPSYGRDGMLDRAPRTDQTSGVREFPAGWLRGANRAWTIALTGENRLPRGNLGLRRACHREDYRLGPFYVSSREPIQEAVAKSGTSGEAGAGDE